MFVSLDWLKEYIDISLSPEDLAEKITMGGVEVEEVRAVGSDSILALAPTPNRGDCLYIIGVANEIAALTGKRVKPPKCAPPKGAGKMADSVEIVVKDSKGAPRYTARVVKGVKIKPSPDWLKKRVESSGIRSINNVVDATNFVLMEMGQPVHAFDLRFLEDAKLVIDRPKHDVKLTALDEKEYTFTKEDILNLDGKRPIGAAGIMGGENSGVVDDTTDLVLESAYFDPDSIRRTSKRTGLISESSRRFEKGVDPEGVIRALHRLTEIILEVAGGVPSADWVDIYPKPFKAEKIELSIPRLNQLLGAEIDAAGAEKILKSIGCEVSKNGKDKLFVTALGSRPDLTRPIDLVEEVARLYGYSNIDATMPLIRSASLVKPSLLSVKRIVSETMATLGFYEALNYSFTSEKQENDFGSGNAIRLRNPLSSDMEYMRTTLVPSLITSLIYNLNRQAENVRLFEIGTVFRRDGKSLSEEETFFSTVMTGVPAAGHWAEGKRPVDLFDVKGAIFSVFRRLGLSIPDIACGQLCHSREGGNPPSNLRSCHPSDSLYIMIGGKNVGYAGRLHPSLQREYGISAPVYVSEISLNAVNGLYNAKKCIYKPISRFPVVVRDVALLLNSGITHEKIVESFNKKVNKLVQNIELFDIYTGKGIPEGKKSMAYRITFGSEERTMEDQEIDRLFAEIVEKVKTEFGAEVR